MCCRGGYASSASATRICSTSSGAKPARERGFRTPTDRRIDTNLGLIRHAPNFLTLRWKLFARHLAASTKPILIGPWRSEVGFEVLYWIPFLNAFRKRYGIAEDRLITIGRGGSAHWYRTAGRGDLYEHVPVEMMRTIAAQEAQKTGSIKQHGEEAWERHVCGLAAQSIGIKHFHVLSPWWLYHLLAPYWEGTQPLRWLDGQLLHEQRIQAPALSQELAAQLPEKYVAMRWYVRPTWPLREDLALWTRKLIEATASRIPVVLIHSGLHVDDHADVSFGPMANVIDLKQVAPQTPLNTLAIQSAVIQKAQGYVGTYGGMSQLAMRLGIPTVALYYEFGQTSPHHLYLTQALSLRTGVPFVATYPKTLEALLPMVVAPRKDAQQ